MEITIVQVLWAGLYAGMMFLAVFALRRYAQRAATDTRHAGTPLGWALGYAALTFGYALLSQAGATHWTCLGFMFAVIGVAFLVLSILEVRGWSTWFVVSLSPRAGCVSSVSLLLAAAWCFGAEDLVGCLGVAVFLAAEYLARSDRRAAQEVLNLEQRTALLERMSHNLRTPVGAIGSLVDALASGAVTDEQERARYLALMRSETDRLSTGLERMLRSARGQLARELDCVTVSVAEFVKQAGERWQTRLPGLRTEATGVFEGTIDVDQVSEAIDALLDNAMRYGGDEVVLTMAAEDVDHGEGHPEEHYVVLAVSDNGPGVPEDERARLLERAQRGEGRTAGQGGFGLGLWAVKTICEAHGGTLSIEDGSRFVMRLPCKKPAA